MKPGEWTGWLAMRALGALALMCCAHGAAAQAYPARPVRIVVPFPAGGGADFMARIVGKKLGDALGQTFVVDNRAGAAGVIGTDMVAKSAADGYTLVLGTTGTHATNPAVLANLPYDPARDFATISIFSNAPFVLCVHPSLPVKNVRELVAFAKRHPGELTYGSSGIGSSTHLGFELFALNAGIRIRHIPYKGLPLAMIDLVAGNTSLVFDAIPSATPHIKSGRVRVLAIGSPQRSPSLPDLPTVAESGLPGYEMGSWYGLFAPAATPKEIVQRLAAETVKASTSADVRARFAGAGTDPLGLSAEESAALLAREIERWSKVAKQAQIKAE
jgi:tripartite-type tricarboxylate transporter receptor subunit TctC